MRLHIAHDDVVDCCATDLGEVLNAVRERVLRHGGSVELDGAGPGGGRGLEVLMGLQPVGSLAIIRCVGERGVVELDLGDSSAVLC